MLEQKGKGNMSKDNSKTCGNKRKNTGESRKIKEMLSNGKIKQTKQDFPKQGKKILSTTGRR